MEQQGTIEEAFHESLLKKTNLAKSFGKISECYVDASTVQLTFRGSSEELLKDNKGNFVSIIQLLSKYDTVLDKLIQLQYLKILQNYLCPLIQNELISVLAEEVFRDTKSAPFFAIIHDTTRNVSKKYQLSEALRYVEIDYHDDGASSELKVVKTFTIFIEFKDSSAIGLH